MSTCSFFNPTVMNKLIAGILIVGLNLLLSQFLPWWNIIPVCFLVVVLFKLNGKSSWFIPAIFLMLSYLIQIFLLDQSTGFRSSERIASIFSSPGFSAYLIPSIGVGIIGGLSGFIAYLFRTAFKKEELVQEEMSIKDYKDTQPDLRDKGIV